MTQEIDLALEHHKAGRLDQAEMLYRRILERQPANPEALYFLGVLAHQAGRNDEAIELIEKAHREGGARAQSLNSLGMAYLASGRAREAKRCFSKALSLKADYAEAHSNLGAALKDLDQIREAEQSCRRAVALMPQSAQFHYNLANLLASADKVNEAESNYRKAIDLSPGYAQALNNLGHVLWRQGRLQEAEASCRAAIAIDERFAQARHNLGKVLEKLGRMDEAEKVYREALALQPDQIETRLNLGNVLQALGRYDAAEASYRAILDTHPEIAGAYHNLGNALARMDRHEEGLSAYRRAIELDPDFAPARWMFAMSQLPAVYASADEPARCRQWFSEELERLAQWLATHADAGPETICQHPFHLPYTEDPNRDLMARHGELCLRVMRSSQPRLAPARRGGRIRVGIVAAHMREHSVWDAFVRGWAHRLDPGRFELQLFHIGGKQDAETHAAKARAAHFEQGPHPLAHWIDLIGGARPEVLLYPEIAMDMEIVKLASLRLAPVQATSWGHPETSGLATIDHYLSAESFEPDAAEQNYSEHLVKLANLGCWYEERPVAPASVDLESFGIEPEASIFVCPGTPFKYAPQHDWVLPAIARRVQRSRFVFFAYRIAELSEKLRRRLQQSFEREGVSFERHVRFVPWLSRSQFHGLMQQADVYLDTIGFSGFNTALQAVECGLPVVTREGRFMRGRLASGILKRLGLPELIVPSEDDYVALAEKLALDGSYRAEMRRRMAAARGVLYEDRDAMQDFEGFLARVARP
jgi:predicted O-linked N-acetylglucosamine transferase (SPINDLY family)